jgi:drug/metabolite transporter (DMT)-like permease
MQRLECESPSALPAGMLRGENTLAFWALMGSGLVWGTTWWPLKHFATLGLDGHAIGLTAYACVALLALPLIWRQRLAWVGEWRALLMIGLFFGCANMAFTSALMNGSVVRAMLLFYLLPCWSALGGAIFLRERIGARRLLAIALSLCGVLVIMGGSAVFAQQPSLGDLLALAAGFFYAAAGIANRRALHIPLASRTLISFVGCTTIALVALPFSLPALPALPPLDWTWLLAFAFVWLLGGTLLTTYGVMHMEASRAGVLQVVELLVAVLSAVCFGGELLGAKEWAGGAMILLATLIEAGNGKQNGNASRDA